MMGSVRAIPKDGALLPLVHRLLGDAKALGQDTGGLAAGRDLGTHGGRSCSCAGPSTWLHSPGGWQGLYPLLQDSSDHEQRIAFGINAIILDATLIHSTCG